ncbi:MAG: nicotinamide mononucleotide transporter [Ruminococcaceae bacterium]|nr:nicotinamide mononucleotide transporter [Oscillospiraceae bacterium]
MKIKRLINYFSPFEWSLWLTSLFIIFLFFCLFDREGYLTLISSYIGVTSLIFAAKGNPTGPALMIIFSVLYGIISYSFSYYGEMATYLGMTAPMSVIALVAWLKNPYGKSQAEVKVNKISVKEGIFAIILTTIVTIAFYFILLALNTANMIPSTISVMTSFLAVYLTWRRSPYYALAYAANDVILIILWILATLEDISYFSVTVCFAVFLVNDLYGFISWQRMQKRQEK